ncbi:HipA family kinase [Terracidiphilus gabretensis]|uniref:HipA family kinase n=1 Tax=Terracidiphilus gabretensis TaxID=1577687 RepID=UPI00071B6E9D|nr:HipA family kinase [Terracidiphilus gabretensis]
MLRTVQATRYVLPLREGGSLPAIVEASDLGMYVVKFRGAGQGIRSLLAELIAGEIGRAIGLRVPELVFIEIDPVLGRNEPDYEIRQLLKASTGLNLALDYLPGSVTFDPAARDTVSKEEASLLVWFDAYTQNVDRTARNANLLVWHKKLYPIDHGAALFFHHDWPSRESKIDAPFPQIESHILLPWAAEIPAVGREACAKLTPAILEEILHQVPEEWLEASAADSTGESPAERRSGYLDFLVRRLNAAHIFEQEAIDARTRIV